MPTSTITTTITTTNQSTGTTTNQSTGTAVMCPHQQDPNDNDSNDVMSPQLRNNFNTLHAITEQQQQNISNNGNMMKKRKEPSASSTTSTGDNDDDDDDRNKVLQEKKVKVAVSTALAVQEEVARLRNGIAELEALLEQQQHRHQRQQQQQQQQQLHHRQIQQPSSTFFYGHPLAWQHGNHGMAHEQEIGIPQYAQQDLNYSRDQNWGDFQNYDRSGVYDYSTDCSGPREETIHRVPNSEDHHPTLMNNPGVVQQAEKLSVDQESNDPEDFQRAQKTTAAAKESPRKVTLAASIEHSFENSPGKDNESAHRATEKKITQTKRNQQLHKKNEKNNRKEGGGTKKKGASLGVQKGTKSKREQNTPDDPVEAKKMAAINESPESRAAFKQFCKVFRNKEKESFSSAEEFAADSLNDGSLPTSVHWQVYIELAGLAKRSTQLDESRRLFTMACNLQPYAPQGWLEYSKLEEECGNMKKCAAILAQGLEHCEYNESLLTRSVKHEEKMGNLSRARELLARLKNVGIQKVWKTVLEGALLEARAGNHRMARRVLKYLMHHVPWYGPLYLEAYKLERDLGRYEEALMVVEKGLKALPRYGPLWFGAFRLCETLDLADKDFDLHRTKAMLDRAVSKISRELIWKAHLEAAHILERSVTQSAYEKYVIVTSDMLDPSRKRIAMTALSCKQNLLWKVWLAGGRMELAAGNLEPARSLLCRANEVVPEKSRITVALDIARVEEFGGDIDLARALLCKYRKRYRFDWKVWLESILLECRNGKNLRAINFARQALQLHSGTGRLWATLVQLRYADGGEMGQLATLKMALRAVPKSGEVWCQGGRIHLNPFSKLFDLKEARRQLQFAARFTPQYGDGFLETLRLEVIERWIVPIALHVWKAVQPRSTDTTDNNGWIGAVVSNSVKLLRKVKSGVKIDEMPSTMEDRSFIPSLRAQLEKKLFGEILETSDLDLRCANADPNYGVLWFFCRHSPIDTSRVIFGRARVLIIEDLKNYIEYYVAAIIRRLAVMAYTKDTFGSFSSDSNATKEEKKRFETMLLQTPSIEAFLKANGLKTDSISGSDFITGLVQMNRHQPLHSKSFSQRKKHLFGGDVLY